MTCQFEKKQEISVTKLPYTGKKFRQPHRFLKSKSFYTCVAVYSVGKCVFWTENVEPILKQKKYLEYLTASKCRENPMSSMLDGKAWQSYTHRIHVWYMYLHLVDFYGKFR